MENPLEQPKIAKPEIKRSETQVYAEKDLKEFENVEIKKISALACWHKISEFIASKNVVGIDDIETVVVSDGKQWENIFGSNDSKSSHKPIRIILKKEIFDNENISDADASWLVHEIGHIKFYQDLEDKLDEYMEEYHKQGEYTDSDMEKFAFELQFEYLLSIGKTKNECAAIIETYLSKSFGPDEREERENTYKKLAKILDSLK